jgi:drug/metabolite transporter (DMT)-like permease
LFRLPQFPQTAVAWMAGLGVLHFVFGRYCNFRANSVAGVNLTAPVVQLQVVVTMVLAVVVLHEPCTALQMLGGVLIIAGSLITQRAPARTAGAETKESALPVFAPRYLAGYLFASLAAIAYGTTPVMARFALENTGPLTGLLGGLVSYVAATAVVSLALLSPQVRQNVFAMNRGNARWFALSGVFVAAAQGFFFAAVSVAPVMLVMPLLQLSLAFRMLFSTWLNPAHEIVGPAGARRRGDLGHWRADGVDRHQPDRRFPGDSGTGSPRCCCGGVGYLPLEHVAAAFVARELVG